MAGGTIYGSVGNRGDSYSYYIDWVDEQMDINSNSSIVKAWVHISCSAHSAYQNNCSQNLYINGVHFSNTLNINLSSGVNVTLIYGETRVYHDADGRKRINISADGTLPYGSGWGPNSGSASADVDLDTIPRYTTVWNAERNKTLDKIYVNWTALDQVDWVQYNLNGAGWVNAYNEYIDSEGKNGYYIITGLNFNTQYTIKTRVRRADSGLWSETTDIYIRTKDIIRITKVDNFNFGENVNMTFSNLSNGTGKMTVKIANTTICTRNNLTGNYILSFTKEELSKMIRCIRDESVAVFFTVTTNDIYSVTAKSFVSLKANIYKKRKGEWVKAKLHKKKENWKLTKLFYKVDGVWRNTK